MRQAVLRSKLELLPNDHGTASYGLCNRLGLARPVAKSGRLDCLVNNAGQGLSLVFESTPVTEIRALFETNTFGVIQLMQAAIPHFRNNDAGSDVNVTSQGAITPNPLLAAYDATWRRLATMPCGPQNVRPHQVWDGNPWLRRPNGSKARRKAILSAPSRQVKSIKLAGDRIRRLIAGLRALSSMPVSICAS
jgi:NAD(P)-dependent dehydrogenase (short-subunit alcohol dehydrogenase family)